MPWGLILRIVGPALLLWLAYLYVDGLGYARATAECEEYRREVQAAIVALTAERDDAASEVARLQREITETELTEAGEAAENVREEIRVVYRERVVRVVDPDTGAADCRFPDGVRRALDAARVRANAAAAR